MLQMVIKSYHIIIPVVLSSFIILLETMYTYSVYCVPCATFNIWIQPRDTWEISNHYSTLNKHLKHSIRFPNRGRIKTTNFYHGTRLECHMETLHVNVRKQSHAKYDCFVFHSMTIVDCRFFVSKMCSNVLGAMYSKLTFNKIIIYIWLCFVFTFVILWFH